jgi:hypothetical protein
MKSQMFKTKLSLADNPIVQIVMFALLGILVGVCTNCFEVGLRSFHSLGVSLFG